MIDIKSVVSVLVYFMYKLVMSVFSVSIGLVIGGKPIYGGVSTLSQ